MDIEQLAASSVMTIISKTDYFVPRITLNEKGLSWDGCIEVYNSAGNTHKKEDFFINMPVQVKGCGSKKLSQDTISYPVGITDMKNYLNAGGTIYFVGYVGNTGEEVKIYYKSLLPYDLKKLIKKYSNQTTKNLKFNSFPFKIDEISELLFDIANNMQLQKAAIKSEDISLEDLIKNGQITQLSFHISRIPETQSQNIADYIIGKEMYLYADLPFGVKLPIQHIEEVQEVRQTIEKAISIKGKIWYDKFVLVHLKNSQELHINKSLKIIFDHNTKQCKIKIFVQGCLTERIKDVDFIIKMIIANQIELDGDIFDLTGSFDNRVSEVLSFCQQLYKSLNDAKDTLDKLGVHEELDCDLLNDEDEFNLRFIIEAVLNERAMPLKDMNYILGNMTIGNLTFVICAIEQEKGSKLYYIYNFNNAPLNLQISGDDGVKIPVSPYILLDKDTIKRACNIDYENMLLQIKKAQFSDVISARYCNLLLEMLLAYDESQSDNKKLFKGIKELAIWLKNNDMYTLKEFTELNYLQVIKRERIFTEDEIKILINIIESSSGNFELLVGAYLLLDNQVMAKKIFDKMDEEIQNIFKTYPIYHFWHCDTKVI